MLCCVLAWMNEYIVQIISATRLWLISRYSHHILKKRRKMTAKNGHPCTEWFSSLCFKQIASTWWNNRWFVSRKQSFYMDNITSTLMIVVFSINWSWMFALLVRRMCCKLELKTLNNWKITASLRNHRKCRMCSDSCICTIQQYSVFFSKVVHKIWRIFPWPFDIVVTSDVPTTYLIFCTKQRESSLFFIDNIRHVTWPFLNAFILPAAWCVFVRKHRKVCCSLLQWSDVIHESDVEHALCAFSGVYPDYFQVFRQFGSVKWKYYEKWHLPVPKIWNPFFILSWVQHEEFHYNNEQGNIL